MMDDNYFIFSAYVDESVERHIGNGIWLPKEIIAKYKHDLLQFSTCP